VIIGGDFNVDFDRDWANTSALRDFCTELNLYLVTDHISNAIDYTYHFAMQRFHCVDHFIVSEQLLFESVCSVTVDHSPDNTSDHDPICMQLRFTVQRLSAQPRSFVPKVAWNKAKPQNLKDYSDTLREALSELCLPKDALVCHDVGCKNVTHITSLNVYITASSNVCLAAAQLAIPHTCKRSAGGHIPGWKEYIEPVRQKSTFWHNIWAECGKRRNGYVADVMRKTHSAYHYAIRHVRKKEREVINERFADAILNNQSRNFWDEVNSPFAHRK